jgi:hypothetical protein
MRIPSPIPALALALAALMVLPALAQDPVVLGFTGTPGPECVPAPWSFERWSPMVGFGDYTASAQVISASGSGAPAGPVLELRCEQAGFIVGSERSLDLSAQRWASWSWRADLLPSGASFRARETNDQVLQLLFGFEGGEVLGYIWDSTGTVGASGSGLSWREDVRVMVLQAGPANQGRWVMERRDVLADFEALFGHAPGLMKGLAVQSNCQHTESSGHGSIGTITLSSE